MALPNTKNTNKEDSEMRGIVKFFNSGKGWGFITDAENDKEIFFHQSNIQMSGYRTLDEGDLVDYEISSGNDDKEQAINVTPIISLNTVEDALNADSEKVLRVRTKKDSDGVLKYYVVDMNSNLQSSELGMSLLEVAAYAGIDVEGLE